MSTFTVYMLESPEGKRYIGLTMQTLERRMRNGNAYKQNDGLYADIQKFGWDAFKKSVLFSGLTCEEGQRMEAQSIAFYNTVAEEHGYNREGGGFHKTFIVDRTREKQRRAKIGKKSSKETRLKQSLATKGRPKSESHKRKIGDANKKMVHQLTAYGEILNVFSSMGEAAQMSGASVPGISMCCHGRRNFAGGSRWEYASESRKDSGKGD